MPIVNMVFLTFASFLLVWDCAPPMPGEALCFNPLASLLHGSAARRMPACAVWANGIDTYLKSKNIN
jgi:hypothetical protein